MVYEHVILIWCEASMRCNSSLYASWHGIKETLDIFLGIVPPRSFYAVRKALRVGTGEPWRIGHRPTISKACSMGDMSGERVCKGSSDTRPLWKKACTILAKCGQAFSCWNMACGVPFRRGSTSGCKTFLMCRFCSNCPQYVGVEIAYCIQWRPKPLH